MAAVISTVVAGQLQRTATDSARANAEAIVRGYVDPFVDEEKLSTGGMRDPAIDAQLERLVLAGDLRRIKLWSRSGTIVYSDDPALRGRTYGIDRELAQAFAGATILEFGSANDHDQASGDRELPDRFLEIYVPIRGEVDGAPIGVYEVYQDARPIEARVEETRRDVFMVAVAGASVLLALVWIAFAGASRLLGQQNRLLRERALRDPLTGLANHGYLLEQTDRALAAKGASGAVALIDIDNFRLLNDGYGHRAGDQALLLVADALSKAARPGQVYGRFGRDEFLVTDFQRGERGLLETVERLRHVLSDAALRFEGSEELPVTVSSGVAQAPQDGSSALELLGVAETALREAKTGGGGTLKVADQLTMESLAAQNSTFGVFEGLVEAVDAKDHYTKFHSEDVTAHALFLADVIGLDEEGRRTLRLAGLLHDVGKVGIPPAILRKPGPLTPAEFETIKQHVALGDAMVGAVPQLAAEVRAGVRHHHERWDGSGYLDGLRGNEIPLTARILAVGDAYSAMTTTRPYRRALAVEEALQRIEEAAGTQLDPDLAVRFVAAMRSRAPTTAADDHAHTDDHRYTASTAARTHIQEDHDLAAAHR